LEASKRIVASKQKSLDELATIKTETDRKKAQYDKEASDARKQSQEEISRARKESADAIYQAQQEGKTQVTKIKEDTARKIQEERRKLDEIKAATIKAQKELDALKEKKG